VLAPR